ncbi:MAG TPA: alpha/beta hydrolase [Tepidisphaeraceae bacterium]|jgi:acetyl esterase/lipase|nr:alpha/beta hydrolase [Tepidisphaeraceae bacterium]
MNRDNRFVKIVLFRAAIASLTLASILMLQGCSSSRPGDAPSADAANVSIRLWNQDAPGALGSADVDVPTLAPFFPPEGKSTGAAFIVCPGGGYQHLAPHEGKPVAEWLNSLGITSFVLKYRLGPKYHYPVEMEDAQRAIRLVRARAGEWRLDPNRIGILGFSAGGHLASTAATHFDGGQPDAVDPIDRASSRPDLAILIYPVITMQGPYAHHGSRQNLLGDKPDPRLEQFLSTDTQVTSSTPPCFLVQGADDQTVPVQNSLLFAMACHAHGVPVELHIFEHGPHGFGLGGNDPILSTWPNLAAHWLRVHGFAEK